ncbi:MAG: hypothetical protein ABI771_05240 [Betaproteobacteria bacterium]
MKKILLVMALAMSLVAVNAEARGGGWHGGGWHGGGRFLFYGALTAPLWYSAWAYSRPWYYTPAPVYVQSSPTYIVTQPGYVVANSQPSYVVTGQPAAGAAQSGGVIELGPTNGGSQSAQPAVSNLPPSEGAQSGRWFIYPGRGQSQGQLAADRSQCNNWAVGESGYDPDLKVHRNPDTGPNDYGRALSACLEGRGYTVR